MADEAAARVEHVFKLLVTGPFAAGKTTLIQSVSQTPVVDTDVVTTGDESAIKSRTTVAMDFGTYVVDGGDVRLLMFGTPGQPRFWFMTDILKGPGRRRHLRRRRRGDRHPRRGRRGDAGAAARPARAARRRRQPLRRAGRRRPWSPGSSAPWPASACSPCQLIEPASGREVVIEIAARRARPPRA